MAFAGVGEALAMCQKCKSLYKKLKAPVSALSDMRSLVEHLESNLVALEEALDQRSVVNSVHPRLVKHLNTLIEDVQDELTTVQRVLKERNPDQQDWIDNISYLVSSWPKEIDSINKRLGVLSDRIDKSQQSLQTSLLAKLGNALNLGGDAQRLLLEGAEPSWKPKQKPKRMARSLEHRSGITVLFVDEFNETWSIVASAYMRLLESRMQQFPAAYWPIKTSHSVGTMVQANSQVRVMPPEYQHWLVPGARPANEIALATLFDDPYTEDAPGKEALRQWASGRTSRGLYEGMFDDSDYVFTFSERTAAELERMRTLWGKQSAKAKISLLGKYWPSPYNGPNIYDLSPSDQTNSAAAQHVWARRVSRIKVGIKLWLNRDFGWTEPSGAANVAPASLYPAAPLHPSADAMV